MKLRQLFWIITIIGAVLIMGGCDEGDDYDWEAIEQDIEQSLREFEARRIYRSLDVDTLNSIPDDLLEQALYDYIDAKIEEAGWDNVERVVSSLPAPIRGYFAMWVLAAEVNNGGYNQFFWNSSHIWIDEAIEGFKLFGEDGLARNAEKAQHIYLSEQQIHRRFREIGSLEALSESYEHTKLNEADSEFFELAAELSKRRIAFIRAHPEMFVGN